MCQINHIRTLKSKTINIYALERLARHSYSAFISKFLAKKVNKGFKTVKKIIFIKALIFLNPILSSFVIITFENQFLNMQV